MRRKTYKSLDADTYMKAYQSHPRHFHGSRLVYPVLSRRSGGISVGVNLSLDKKCNINCRYCQVERQTEEESSLYNPKPLLDPFQDDFKSSAGISMDALASELRNTLQMVITRRLYDYPPFDAVPDHLRRLNDIALSGDGEPTASVSFLPACGVIAQVKKDLALADVKIILITNATLLHRQRVRQGLEILDDNQGEIWAKLDAGTAGFFEYINQTVIPFSQILDNLLAAARKRPIVLQTLMARLEGTRLPREEVLAYAGRVNDIIRQGGQISYIQLHTIARPPRDTRLSALSNQELDQIAAEIRSILEFPVVIKKYYSPPQQSA